MQHRHRINILLPQRDFSEIRVRRDRSWTGLGTTRKIGLENTAQQCAALNSGAQPPVCSTVEKKYENEFRPEADVSLSGHQLQHRECM